MRKKLLLAMLIFILYPLLSRMDNFYIDEYTEFEYDSHTFYDEEDYE